MNAHTQSLAHALLSRAAHVFPTITEEALDPALAAVDTFVAAPSPASYLVAVRALRTASGTRPRHTVAVRLSTQRVARARGTLATLPRLDPSLLVGLQDLPVDSRAGARLHALACLLGTWTELAGRAEAASASLRKQFDAHTPAKKKRR